MMRKLTAIWHILLSNNDWVCVFVKGGQMNMVGDVSSFEFVKDMAMKLRVWARISEEEQEAKDEE